MNKRLSIRRPTTLGVLCLGLCSSIVSAETFTPGDVAALRNALLESSGNEQADIIDLGGQTFILDEALLINPEDHELELRNGTLERLQGSAPTRLVEVTRNGTSVTADADNQVSFRDMSFLNGRVDVGDVSSNSTGGGAILANWWILVEDSRFENNAVVGNGSGGAILSDGGLTVRASDFINNTALSDVPGTAGNGGAIIIKREAYEISESSFVGNSANAGGALFYSVSSSGQSFIAQSFFQDNSATTLGGAVYSATDDLNITTSTFHRNSAGIGGGAVYSQSKGYEAGGGARFESYGLNLSYSALIDNNAAGGSGGDGVLAFFQEEKGVILVSNIFGDNGDENCASIGGGDTTIHSNFYFTFADDETCGTVEDDQGTTDDRGATLISDIRTLFSGDLARNGGRTPTFALSDDSLAIDASEDGLCYPFDQRGVDRSSDGFSGTPGVGTGVQCDVGPYEMDFNEFDIDEDGIPDTADNCPADVNPGQENIDGDQFGDACDDLDNRDEDDDGRQNFEDNCPQDANPSQIDSDNDGLGDVCDPIPTGDVDEDGVDDSMDNCRSDYNPDQLDADLDGIGDACDPIDNRDIDGDGVLNDEDNCPAVANGDQDDIDGDGDGDACDTIDNRDTDGDGVLDVDDNCPMVANGDQDDIDGDGDGDACDTIDNRDTDGDGVLNDDDNCPLIANPSQTDTDGDGIGDACDEPVDTGDSSINAEIEQAAETLDDIIAASSGQTRRILAGAASRLEQALQGNQWSTDDELSSRRGNRVFVYTGLAINEIERIADYRRTDGTLRSELDAITTLLLDQLRVLAENRIAEAEAAGGRQWKIARARIALGLGDRYRNRDWLKGAAYNYGYAWGWAGSAL